jgi:hypothetical protein
VNFGVVVETARQAAQLPGLDQTRESLIDRSAARYVEEVAGREDTTTPATAGTSHDPMGN